MSQVFNLADRVIGQLDRMLRTLSGATQPIHQASPAHKLDERELSPAAKRHAAGLMRVNHTGEVCAQALYQGQALTAKLTDTRAAMDNAAEEEIDHLAWCEERLAELGSKPSVLNPLWYGLSFSLGATAGAISDRVSLGFVAATEEQVCSHLRDHLHKLPADDVKSRAIVRQMLDDEARHGDNALAAGGLRFPRVIKLGMSVAAKLMTQSSYRI